MSVGASIFKMRMIFDSISHLLAEHSPSQLAEVNYYGSYPPPGFHTFLTRTNEKTPSATRMYASVGWRIV
jgi:hypothetical protein